MWLCCVGTHRQARGHTPQGVCRHQTPHRPPPGESRADLMPGEEGRCTSWPENSTLWTAPLWPCRNFRDSGENKRDHILGISNELKTNFPRNVQRSANNVNLSYTLKLNADVRFHFERCCTKTHKHGHIIYSFRSIIWWIICSTQCPQPGLQTKCLRVTRSFSVGFIIPSSNQVTDFSSAGVKNKSDSSSFTSS